MLSANGAAAARVAFGDVVHHRSDSVSDPSAEGLERQVALEHLEPGFPCLRQWSEIQPESSFRRRFRAGQVLFAKRRVYQRKAALVSFDGVCSGDLLVFEADEDRLLPTLLPFLVQSEAFMRHAEQTSAGSLSPRTKWKDLAKFEFQLPTLEKQRSIALLLQAAVDDLVGVEGCVRASRLAQVALCKERFEALLQQGGKTRLEDVLDRSQYGLSTKATDTGTVAILGMGQMIDGRMTTEGAGHVTPSPEELDAYRLHPGDILFNRTNSIDHVGRVAFNELEDEVVFASYLIRLTANPDVITPRYLYEYLASSPAQRRIRRFITRGVSQANINATNLKSIEVPVPSIEEQQELVARIQALAVLAEASVKRQRRCRLLLSMLIERSLG